MKIFGAKVFPPVNLVANNITPKMYVQPTLGKGAEQVFLMDDSKKRSLLDSLDAAFSKTPKRVKVNRTQALEKKSSKKCKKEGSSATSTSLGTMLQDRIYGHIAPTELLKVFPSSVRGDSKGSDRQKALQSFLHDSLVCAPSLEKVQRHFTLVN